MKDERFYAQVADELSRASAIPGLWAKAFAESNGNEPQAKALYLRYRAKQLADAELQAIAVKNSDAIARNKLAQQLEKERRTMAEEKAKAAAKENAAEFTLIHLLLLGIAVSFIVITFI